MQSTMRRILVLPVLCLVLALTAVQGAAQVTMQERRISVTGSGEVTAEPDMATIRIGVSHRAATARAAMDAVSDTMDGLIARLADLDVPPRDVQTSDLRLGQIYENRSTNDQPPRVLGYDASNTLSVRVRQIDKLGTVLQAMLEDGANRFDGLEFGLLFPEPRQDEARRLAVADALRKARLYADAAGVGLGPILRISETGGAVPRPMMAAPAFARSEAMPVALGELSLSAQVQMEFAILDE
jgi:hypothetical protein